MGQKGLLEVFDLISLLYLFSPFILDIKTSTIRFPR